MCNPVDRLASFDISAAKRNDVARLFHRDPDVRPDLAKSSDAVEACEKALLDLLPDLRRATRMPQLSYVTVAAVEHLIEVPEDRPCPNTWIKVSSNKSKKVIRYHPPVVTEAAAALERSRERHAGVAKHAWVSFLHTFAPHFSTCRDAARAIATLDALHSLAILSRTP